MVPQVRTLAALAEDPSSVPSTHIALPAICKSSSKGSDTLFRALEAQIKHPYTFLKSDREKREEGATA